MEEVIEIHYDAKKTIIGLQEILADVYGRRRLIGDLLISVGLSVENVNILKKEALFDFCENIKFALECRFLVFQNGHRLHNILKRRYGLFGNEAETAEAIGNSLQITPEKVHQLQNKAIKQLKTGVKINSIKILIVLAACKTLKLDATEILHGSMLEETPDNSNEINLQPDEIPNKPKPGLPQADFYIQGSFDNSSKRGSYELLIVFGEHNKHIEKSDLTGNSDVSMILEGVITGLEMLKKPCEVMVFSNTLFGLSHLYRKGRLCDFVKESVANYELKSRILTILKEQGHTLDNVVESDMRKIIKGLRG